MLIARKRARSWLAKQSDAELIFFSFKDTLNMYSERDRSRDVRLGEESSLTDNETDVFNDLTQRHTLILEAWNDRINKEFLKVSENEASAALKMIQQLYSSVYGRISDE
jgi:hypothetical protein